MTGGDTLIVIGGGGHAKVIVGVAKALSLDVLAIHDEDGGKAGTEILGIRVRGGTPEIFADGNEVVIAIGDNRTRARLAAAIDAPFATLVHPHAWVSPDARLGPGTVVFAGAVIQPGAQIGAHSIVNTGATVDHDCQVGDHCHLAPGVHLAGDVNVENGALLGVGSAVINGITIGAWSTLGAGGVATQDVAAEAIAVGVPARIVRGGA